ncbi:MAG: T9SS type A sorting domain-containing protein [Bacteroidetes bacterium]|nr:T9SS type A sorting domain-containing protein [Bacteroidota bacterium]
MFSGTADFDPALTYFLSEQVGGSTYDIFFAKYDNLANFLWAKSMGSTYPDAGNSIALSPIGSGIYLTGYFTNSIDLDPGPGNATYTLQTGNESIFLAKYSNTVTNIFNEQANENITLSAYPNPSKETITIKTGRGTFIATSNLKIVNTLGETVYQKQIVNTQTPIQLDVSFLKAGLYVVSLSSQKGNGYARFMKLE